MAIIKAPGAIQDSKDKIIVVRKENDKMEFIKGTIIGMVAGTCLGVIKNEMFCDVIKQGKRKFRKIQKKMNF